MDYVMSENTKNHGVVAQ